MGVLLSEGAAPSTPAANKAHVFLGTDQTLKMVRDTGEVVALLGGGERNNFLNNAGFTFAQRQAPGTLTTYNSTDRVYGTDRWATGNENASIQYQRIDSIGAVETGLLSRYYGKFKKITAAGKIYVTQAIESVNMACLRGLSVRFSAKMRYTIAASMTVRMSVIALGSGGTVDVITAPFQSAYGANGVDPTWGTNLTAIAPTANSAETGSISGNGLTCVLSAAWQRFSAVFAIPSTAKNIVVVIWSDNQLGINDELNVTETQLTRGTDIVDFIRTPVEQDLAACQRYYCKTFQLEIAPAQNIGTGTGEHRWSAISAGATAKRGVPWRFPVRMRQGAIAVVTTYNPAAANTQVRDITAAADCSAVATNLNQSELAVQVSCTGAAGTAAEGILGVHLSVTAEI